MITSIEIENFKGIGERIKLDISPMTLLFGPNSAGKSSIIQALHYAREVLLNYNVDADRTETGGDYIELGGFNNLLHGRNNWGDSKTENPAREVVIGLTATVTEMPTLNIDRYLSEPRTEFNERFFLHPHMKKWLRTTEEDRFYTTKDACFGQPPWKLLESVGLELSIGKSDTSNDVGITKINIVANGISIVKLELLGFDEVGDKDSYLFGYTIEYFNFDHPLLPDCFWDLDKAPERKMISVPLPWKQHVENMLKRNSYMSNLFGRMKEEPLPTEEEHEYRIQKAKEELKAQQKKWQDFISTATKEKENLPDWKQLADFVMHYEDENFFGSPTCLVAINSNENIVWVDDLADGISGRYESIGEAFLDQGGAFGEPVGKVSDRIEMSFCAMRFYVEYFAACAFKAIKTELQQFRYLGPIRKTVPSSVAVPEYIDPSRWPAGLAAWDRLLQEPQLMEVVNRWISKEDRLYLGCMLSRKSVKRLEMESYINIRETKAGQETDKNIFEQIDEILSSTPEEIELTIKPISDRFSVYLKPRDVGVGIGQVLPIIVAVLDPDVKMLAIEQPELHLHPKLQAVLGDLLITGALRIGRESSMFVDNRFDESDNRRDAPIIVETHSEHLILRLLRRIRETTKGTAPPGRELRTDDISIYFLRNEKGNTRAIKIDVDVKGEFIQPWPDDFFEIDFYERFS